MFSSVERDFFKDFQLKGLFNIELVPGSWAEVLGIVMNILKSLLNKEARIL